MWVSRKKWELLEARVHAVESAQMAQGATLRGIWIPEKRDADMVFFPRMSYYRNETYVPFADAINKILMHLGLRLVAKESEPARVELEPVPVVKIKR